MHKNFNSPHFYQFPVSWNSQYTCLFMAFGSCCILIPIPSVLLSFLFSLWACWKQGRCCICLSLSPSPAPWRVEAQNIGYLNERNGCFCPQKTHFLPITWCSALVRQHKLLLLRLQQNVTLHPLLYLDPLRTFCSVTSPSYLSLYFSSNRIFRNTSVPWSHRLGSLWNLPSPILEINF